MKRTSLLNLRPLPEIIFAAVFVASTQREHKQQCSNAAVARSTPTNLRYKRAAGTSSDCAVLNEHVRPVRILHAS